MSEPWENPSTVNDRDPNVRDEAGFIYLIRCYACDPDGRENTREDAFMGICHWCGWKDSSKPQMERVLDGV